MAKGLINAVLDAGCIETATCTQIDVVSDVSTPTDLTNSLADTAMIAGDGNGDYTIADDPTNGRRLTMAAKSSITVTASGTPRHIVLSLGGVIKAYTACTGDDLVIAGQVNIPTFYLRFADPV